MLRTRYDGSCKRNVPFSQRTEKVSRHVCSSKIDFGAFRQRTLRVRSRNRSTCSFHSEPPPIQSTGLPVLGPPRFAFLDRRRTRSRCAPNIMPKPRQPCAAKRWRRSRSHHEARHGHLATGIIGSLCRRRRKYVCQVTVKVWLPLAPVRKIPSPTA